jgi:hypothetical protein
MVCQASEGLLCWRSEGLVLMPLTLFTDNARVTFCFHSETLLVMSFCQLLFVPLSTTSF